MSAFPRNARRLLLAAATTTAAGACRPDFGERESSIDRVQVLGMRVEPPEAKPGETVTVTMLVVSPSGPMAAAATSWAQCATPKLLTENGAVSPACLDDGVVALGESPGTITTTLPASGCFTFGPETQSAEVRPRDPDVTGGFFVPLRARLTGAPSVTSFAFARITCNLAQAPADVAARFRDEYRSNQSPTLLPVEARLEGAAALVPLDAVPRGARVVLRTAWKPEDAETYALFDVREQTLVTRRESLRVSWFSTAGSFDVDRSGRSETEQEAFTENTWTAPDEPRNTHLFFVLRDARGGVAFASLVAVTR